MFGKIAKFFRKSAGTQSKASAPAPLSVPEQKALGRPKFAAPGMDSAAAGNEEAPEPAMALSAKDISGSIAVPFSAILPLIPKELQGKGAAGGQSYKLPKAVALEQLSRGAVKIPFGDLRRAAPAGVFAGGSSQDAKLVDLPLREILKQFKPTAFARRPSAHRITVPDEVTDLFGSKGERLTDLRVMDKSEVKPISASAPAPAPAASPAAPPLRAAEGPATPIRVAPNLAQQMQAASPAPAPAPTTAFPMSPKPGARPAAPTAPKLPAQTPGTSALSMRGAPKSAKPLPQSAPAFLPNAMKLPTTPAPVPAAMRAQTADPADATSGALSVSVGTVNQKWPEAIRSLVQQLGVTDLEIPNALIETALKLGRIAFQWQQVVTWLRPAPERDLAQEHAGAVLELPLSVIAPLFLQQNKYKGKRSSVPGGIPDLFSNKGEKVAQPPANAEVDDEVEEEPQAAARPVAAPPSRPVRPVAPAQSPAPVAPPPVPAFIPDRTRAQNLSQLFREPNKKNWTPNEIVHKTITMPGITGALIALQDGLLVAGSMPPPWKTETIAAFIPQIFGRLTQYTKELQMGEVATVSFGVESGTLQIFNAGIIYFGALGRPGAALPVEDLTLIATELGRHTK